MARTPCCAAPNFEDELAHDFKFGSLYHEALYVQGPDGSWGYTGTAVPYPDVAPMLEVPEGGYHDPSPEVESALLAFNQSFSSVVDGLQTAWSGGGNDALDNAMGTMLGLGSLAAALYAMPVPGTAAVYGPTFEYLVGAA